MVNYCRYCLTVCDENVPEIKQIIRDITKDILPGLDLTITEEPVICSQCEAILRKCFNFKSTYFSAIDSVLKSVDTDNTLLGTLDLKEIYMKKHNISDIDLVNNQNVCRFCFELVTDESFISLAEVDEHVLDNCMTLVTLNFTSDPVICHSCHNSLRFYSSFIDKCVETGEKIKKLNKEVSIKEEIVSENDLASCSKEQEIDLANKQLKQEDMMGLLEDSEVNVKTELLTDELIIESDIVYPKTEDVMENQEDIHDDLDYEDTSELKVILEEREELQRYRCKSCSYKTKSKKAYDVHIAKGHAKRYKCEYCTFTAFYRYKVKIHMLKHKEWVLKHKEPSELTKYKCQHCDYESVRKQNFKKHELKHKDPSKLMKYKCQSCDYETIHKDKLKRHELIHKNPAEVTKYKCKDCNFVTLHRSSLSNHSLLHKNNSTKYKCQQCDYETICKYSLKSHKMIHRDSSELAKFKCTECDFETVYKSNLKRHALIHKDRAETAKYKCQECNFVTLRGGSLRRHVLVHKSNRTK